MRVRRKDFLGERVSLEDRFWSKVDRQPFGCWEWTGAKAPHGYGALTVRRKVVRAHRVSWEMCNGPIGSNLNVLHRCDNPPCVRPSHLFLGTQLDNALDMMAKNRWFKPPFPSDDSKRLSRENIPRGEKSPSAKLTDFQANEILRRIALGERQVALAAEYGVSQPLISAIKIGRVRKSAV